MFELCLKKINVVVRQMSMNVPPEVTTVTQERVAPIPTAPMSAHVTQDSPEMDRVVTVTLPATIVNAFSMLEC